MKALKRITSTALAAVLSINMASAAVPAIVSAQEQNITINDVLKEGLSKFETAVDISAFEYGISAEDIAEISSIINQVFVDPELFYLNVASVNVTAKNGIITKVKFEYNNTIEEVTPIIEEFNQKVDSIISNNITEDMTDLEKALKLHDYIVLNSKYDLESTIEDYNGGISAYDILVMGNGVCQGYAQAYGYLLNHLGIETIMVTSEAMVHAWNLVKIDGEWYHVDVTWDDPLPDAVGRVNHAYFMLSDEAIATENQTRLSAHHSWDSKGITATSTKYDNEFWASVGTEIFINNHQWYFISEDGQYSTYSADSAQVSTNVSLDEEKWYVWNETTQFWAGKYTSLIVSDGKVYYNTPTMIYSMNLDGSCKEGLKYVNPYETNGYMYGLVLENDKLYAVIKQAPVDEGTLVDVMDLHLENYSYIETMLSSIEDMQDGDSSVFDVTEEKVLPAQAIELIKGRDIEIVLEIEDSYSWAINGQDVSSAETKDINLEINQDKGEVPESMLADIASGKDTVELDLEHDGEFGFKADISYNIGSEFSERPATLYYYNESENKMDKVQDVVVNADGKVVISLNHASSYVVVMDQINIDDKTYKDPSVTTDVPKTEQPTTTAPSETEPPVTTEPTTTTTTTTAEPSVLKGLGDINSNGTVDLTDLTKISLHLLGDSPLPTVFLPYADVTFDGIVDLCDLATMKQYIMKDITSFTK